jgi:pSer/pThr/pTyr-binding forkhead associated (FHA) protein
MQVLIVITRDLKRSEIINTLVESGVQELAHLVVVDTGQSYSIKPGTVFNLAQYTTIGRALTNTISIEESSISAEHARIWFQHDSWYVEDAHSSNGTFVRNEPVSQGQSLLAHLGDIITLGNMRFKITR